MCLRLGSNSGRPPSFSNQITLLKYFRNYMSEHLLKAGANITPREGDELARLPYLRTWFRTRSAIILHLSNGCVQINFFQVNQGQGELGWGTCVCLQAPRVGWEERGVGPVLGIRHQEECARVGEGQESLISWNVSPVFPSMH